MAASKEPHLTGTAGKFHNKTPVMCRRGEESRGPHNVAQYHIIPQNGFWGTKGEKYLVIKENPTILGGSFILKIKKGIVGFLKYPEMFVDKKTVFVEHTNIMV